ncbi:TetR/AcrR family transcriptional regulator [Pseudomaricurvus alkylphenolicus]|uniref:TetR/AcrR family transcriptional regulator n=1 Tax=Pseudomaricurvus alkylphenolicus TaxID=1306991 RepID=UPI00141DE18E|nr:TetR/AcrR family transcriptional regulator [Pseudomaricurvus alkylphenolicus]NIB42464.1 TetR/AcrR family transcriptional regulator [Pseudomaricurvus alkylphenolicus]
MIAPIKFATYMEVQAQEIQSARSAKKSQLRLMAALANLLESAEFADIKVIDITKKAGLAKGTFFIHFKTKDDIVEELLQQYVSFERNMLPVASRHADPFDGILEIVNWYEKTFATNHGVLGCLVQLSGGDTRYRKLWLKRNSELLNEWVGQASATLDLGEENDPLVRHVLHAAGAIMDQSLFERYGLAAKGEEYDLDTDSLIEMHAVLMYRAVYGQDPEPSKLKIMKPLVERKPDLQVVT